MFVKYMHIERLEKDDVAGILDGTVGVQPKIDGTNGSIWWEDGEIKCGSRNRQINSLDEDNQGFMNTVLTKYKDRLTQLFTIFPEWRLYGEFLVSHSLKTYEEDAWGKFYIFDVFSDLRETFIPYQDYSPHLRDMNLDYIPVIATLDNADQERVESLLEKNTFLIKDGCSYGEGLVLKNYDYVNKYGRVLWAKVVANKFKEAHVKEMGGAKIEYQPVIERKIAEKYVTVVRIDKMVEEMGEWSQRRIPELFNRIYHDVVAEELWDFIKKHNNKVVISFNSLFREIVRAIKSAKPELF